MSAARELLPDGVLAYEGSQLAKAAILSRQFWGPSEAELVRPDAPFFFRLRHTAPDFVTLAAVSLDAWVEARVEEPRDHYLIFLPEQGQIRLDIAGQQWKARAGQGTICSPDEPYEVTLEGEANFLCVRIDRDAILGSLADLTGRRIDENPQFFPVLDLRDERIASFERLVRQLGRETAVHSASNGGRLFLDQLRQSLVTLLLECQHHTLSENVREGRKSLHTRALDRALSFLRDHLEDPLTVEDLAAAARVSPRTLFRDFKREMGMSPMEVLREERLGRIRTELSKPGADSSVTDVAFRWGFNHLGRLAGFYRDRFGESPSDTLQRARELAGLQEPE